MPQRAASRRDDGRRSAAALFAACRVRSGSEPAVSLAEPLELPLGEGRVGVGRGQMRHQPDDVRARAAASRENPKRPMPVSSLTCTGTPSGIGPSPTTSSSLPSRASRISARVGPSTRIRGPGRTRLRDRPSATVATHRAVAPASSAAGHVGRAVPVSVGLDDGPELGAAERAPQRRDVPPHGPEVDRDLRASASRTRGSSSITSLATRPACSARQRRRRARGPSRPPRPRAAGPCPSRGTRR